MVEEVQEQGLQEGSEGGVDEMGVGWEPGVDRWMEMPALPSPLTLPTSRLDGC